MVLCNKNLSSYYNNLSGCNFIVPSNYCAFWIGLFIAIRQLYNNKKNIYILDKSLTNIHILIFLIENTNLYIF